VGDVSTAGTGRGRRGGGHSHVPRLLITVFFCFLGGMLGGCASVSVVSIQETRALAPSLGGAGGGKGGGTTAVVEDFCGPVRGGTLYYDSASGLICGESRENGVAGKLMADILRKELERRGVGRGLRVRGQVISEEAGSAAMRALFGLGLGGSRLETRTLVFNENKSSKIPWLTVWTDGGSGREPGAAFSIIPPPFGPLLLPVVAAGAGVAALSGAGKGTSQDARRTARVLTDAVVWAASGRKVTPPKFRGAIRLPSRSAGITTEGRNLSLSRTSYIGDAPKAAGR
jgi:hypothetical protein